MSNVEQHGPLVDLGNERPQLPARARNMSPIVPRATIAGRALVAVVAIMTFLASLTTGAVLLAPLAVWNWPHHPLPSASWVSALLLGVVCTGFAFVLYYRLVARIGAPRTSTVTYLIPLFGVIWAWLLLGEPLTMTMAIAGALILAGVALSQQRARRA